MVCSKFGVNFFMCLTKVQRFESAIVGRQFLLDDISLNSYSQMICRPRQIGSGVVVNTIFSERAVTQIATQYGCHSQFVRFSKCMWYLLYLPARFRGAEINSSSYGSSAHV